MTHWPGGLHSVAEFARLLLISINNIQMPIFETYRDKKVLVTGTTGFLGKILLEKMLYALDGLSKLYVLIRAKKGSKLNERFKKEILDSPCFDRLREKHGHNFDKYIEEKVQPV